MKITAVAVHGYSLPLVTPLRVAGRLVDRREGWLLQVTSADGAVGWGEVAPLPGFSVEEPATVRAQLLDLKKRLPGAELDPEALRAGRPLRSVPLASSVCFGLESALLQAAATTPGQTASTCPLNALAAGTLTECVERARAAVAQGFPAIKLKVGRHSVEDDVERIRQVSACLGGRVALRLDANRAWSLETACEVARRLPELALAYVEEPLADPSQLAALHGQTGWPLALDESLQQLPPDTVPARMDGVVAWVLKPTLLGGVAAALRWQQHAQTAGVQAVISSSFESGVGLRMLAELAVQSPEVPAGLDTYRSLAADTLEPRLDFSRGHLDLVRARTASINLARLVPWP